MKQMTADQFLFDVANHALTVKHDDGLYRHLLFRKPGNSNMWFEIITWPQNLTINGDMGTWSFSRIEDMFGFFRSKELRINPYYWSEKVTSESRYGGPSEKFMPEVFKENVIGSLDGYGLSDSQKEDVIAALNDEVFRHEEEWEVRRELADFKHEDFEFSDSWEIRGKGYTYHFLWCLHAIVWAIQKYDTQRSGLDPANGSVSNAPAHAGGESSGQHAAPGEGGKP